MHHLHHVLFSLCLARLSVLVLNFYILLGNPPNTHERICSNACMIRALWSSRLHWESRNKGHFEDLHGPDVVGLPNGLAWDEHHMYHVDSYARTITAYETDEQGAPIRHDPNKPVQGKIVVRVSEKDGEAIRTR